MLIYVFCAWKYSYLLTCLVNAWTYNQHEAYGTVCYYCYHNKKRTRRHSWEFEPTPYCWKTQTLTLILTLTFDFSTQNHTTSRIFRGHSYTKFEHFVIFRFWVILRTIDKRHTDKQTVSIVLPTSTDRVCVGNYHYYEHIKNAWQ